MVGLRQSDWKIADSEGRVRRRAMGVNFRGELITATISREGDKLMFETPGSGKVELLPESENSFFSNALPVTIRFVKDETGKVTHLILLNNGREAGRARKID